MTPEPVSPESIEKDERFETLRLALGDYRLNQPERDALASIQAELAETRKARDVRDYSLRMTERALAEARELLRGVLFHIDEHDHHGDCRLVIGARTALSGEGDRSRREGER